MNPARLLFLSVALCVIPLSALAEDSRPKNLIRMDLYEEGYRADQASDYVGALEKLSAFKKLNNARLAAATTSSEIAFRDALAVKLKQLTRKVEQNTGVGKSTRVAAPTPNAASTDTHQSTVASKSTRVIQPFVIPGANTNQSTGTGKKSSVPLPTPPPVPAPNHNKSFPKQSIRSVKPTTPMPNKTKHKSDQPLESHGR
jgi:hypothetical protein